MYDVSIHEALLEYNTNRENGLTEAEARRRLDRFGVNALPGVPRQSGLARFASQFKHPLIYILIAAGVVTLAIGEQVEAVVIFGVVLVNAIVGYLQETRAERALEALAAMLIGQVTVIREGRKRQLPVLEVVPGDLLVLKAGDAVGADMRLIEVQDLQVDESALTGESQPIAKDEIVLDTETIVADRTNMAFLGTHVTHGSATGLVVATGGQTELGLIHRLIGESMEIATPLTRKIAHFSKIITVVILVLAVITYLIGLARGEDPVDLIVAAVALAVGAIPEGLPAAVTITLAIGVSRMAQRSAIVRRLPAVETLGSTTIICTDKTGTLTENQMTVGVVIVGDRRFLITGTGYQPQGEILREDRSERESDLSNSTNKNGLTSETALNKCLLAGVLCNNAELVEDDGEWNVIGDPTEAALQVSAIKGGFDIDRTNEQNPRVAEVPFQFELKLMATLNRDLSTKESHVYVKGAVEQVLDRCVNALSSDGQIVPLNRDQILTKVAEMASDAMRLIAFAYKKKDDGSNELDPDRSLYELTFIGLQAMKDPLRPEAIQAVATCQKAGIAVKMITGDHPETARSIAEQMGFNGNPSGKKGRLEIVTGDEIERLGKDELSKTASQTSVFARVSPEQKLRLVVALQSQGHIVAMTGDGVNDAPALKQADIGIAMGSRGTEVAREAADIVLTDDNFASIESAVEEGRHTFDNLMKFIVWTLPTNAGEGLVILTAIAAAVTIPILPVQILWINMTTAGVLGLTLAFERKEPRLMDRPPRNPKSPLLTREMVIRILLVSLFMLVASFGLFQWELDQGATTAEARTVAVNVFVIIELFYLLNCRSLSRSIWELGVFSNLWVWVGVGAMIVLQLLFTYASFMNSLFSSAPIDAEDWLKIFAAGVACWVFVGLEKMIQRKHSNKTRS